jgi:hypothetical protein
LPCAQAATVKQAIESVGVPHTEVELILVDGRSVEFRIPGPDGDRISVYPMFEAFDIEPLLRVRGASAARAAVLADAQLGGLARRLRMLGFDTCTTTHADDRTIRTIAAAERRTILSRDRQLLHLPRRHARLLRACAQAGAAAERGGRPPSAGRRRAPVHAVSVLQ